MNHKLIIIEGTDCSGKETQSKLLVESLQTQHHPIERISFPDYDSPTGRIVGGPYLGKPHIMPSFFPEGAPAVPPKVASLYYGADRLYALPKLQSILKTSDLVVDRYTFSNMAHQGGKLKTIAARNSIFQWLDDLEFGLLGLPRPDLVIFLYMPYEFALKLRKNRPELPDGHESSPSHLKNAEKTYLELAKKYNFVQISCVEDNEILSIEAIHQKVLATVQNHLT